MVDGAADGAMVDVANGDADGVTAKDGAITSRADKALANSLPKTRIQSIGDEQAPVYHLV